MLNYSLFPIEFIYHRKVSHFSVFIWRQTRLILSYLESIMEACSVVLTDESVDEILWCDHSNKTFTAVLLHGIICFFNIL